MMATCSIFQQHMLAKSTFNVPYSFPKQSIKPVTATLRTPLLQGVRHARRRASAISSNAQVHPIMTTFPSKSGGPLVFYVPGADGSGQAIQPQVQALEAAGITVVSLYIPPSDRSTWDLLLLKTIPILRQAVADAGRPAILLGESFGACLALRIALAVPDLLSNLVLINSATAFNGSLFGLASFVSSTNLLSIFPEPLWNTAQTIVMPLLLDSARTSKDIEGNLKGMLDMAERPGSVPVTRRKSASIFHEPAMAANFRINLLKEGNLPDYQFRKIRTRTLLVCSAKDRLFSSLQEGARLQQLMPNARRLILPYSSHTPMLESDINIVSILTHAGILKLDDSPTSSSAQQTRPSPLPTQRTTSKADLSLPKKPVTPDPVLDHGPSAPAQPNNYTHQPNMTILPDPATSTSTRNTNDGTQSVTQPASGSLDEEAKPATSGSDQDQDQSGPPNTDASKNTKKGAQYNVGIYDGEFEDGAAQFQVWRELISPVLLGVENLPSPGSLGGRSLLFIGNHTQFGLYDLPLLYIEMYYRGYQLTGLAHKSHWNTPMGPFFERFGSVKASPLTAHRLLKSGSNVLLFPGGAREVLKRRGERYQLMWKEDTDFVRLAAKCNSIIVPFGAVGADDAFDLYMDTDEILENETLGPITKTILASVDPSMKPEDSVFPITTIPGTDLPSPLPFPNLNRVYFKFGEPVDCQGIDSKDVAACSRVYKDVRLAVEEQISDLLVVRDDDPDSSAVGRLVNSAKQVWLRTPAP